MRPIESIPSGHPHAIKIAVIEEQIFGLREQSRAHSETAQKRFDSMEKKLDELTAIMNRGRGAYAASMALAAMLGALVLKGSAVLSSFFHK